MRSHQSEYLFSFVALATALLLLRADAAGMPERLPCPDGKPADENLIARAAQGDIHAQLSLALCYRDGKGVKRDYGEAMHWAHLAADRGDPAAMDFVGWMFLEGLGVKCNPTIAAGYFKAAAGQSATAAWNLGQCYFGAQGVEQDVPKALEVWKKAAAMGHGRAASTAAMVYLAGEGVTTDPAAARQLAMRAKELNDPSGLVVLGEIQFQAGEIEQARENWTKVSQMMPTGRTGHPEQPSDNMAAQQGADLLKLIDYRHRNPEPGKFALVAMPHIHQGWNNCGATTCAMLARSQGKKLGGWDFKRLCPSPLGTGTDWGALLKASEKIGLRWKLVTFTPDDAGFVKATTFVRAEIDAGHPVVIDFKFTGPDYPNGEAGHTLAIVGYLAEENLYILCNPAIATPGLQLMTAADLKHFWRSDHYGELSNGVLSRPAIVIDKPNIREMNIGGYLSVDHSQAPASFNAGYSIYTAAWPLVEKYQGHRFQSGLYGTWMFAQYDGRGPDKLYCDIEGGLGWWTDTRFPTETPKFIMGGVGPNFSEIANGPAHGAGDWNDPRGLYGVAQLSPWLLFPIDGLNVRQGTCGQLFGYGYFSLPLVPAKATTDGAAVPTGDHSWTLFLNTKNFKGPVAFFTPYFWSHTTVKKPEWAGKLLDSRPSQPNKPFSMETAYIPVSVFEDAERESYFRAASTLFPVDADGNTVVMHRATVYNKDALWNDVKRWFDGGAAANGSINPRGAVVQKVSDGGAGWKIWPPKKGEEPVPLAWKTFATPCTPDALTFGYRWNDQLTRIKTANGSLVKLPEYFHLTANAKQKPEWTPVAPMAVPADTKLAGLSFDRPSEAVAEPYTTPEEPNSCWKKPGPVAGPFQARLGDGSVVTYYWYRFADQPALLNAGLTADEREQFQKRVEKIHRSWPKDRDYLAPPTVGTLCDLDPALLVTPPKGKEVGYVPIATRQQWGGSAIDPRGH